MVIFSVSHSFNLGTQRELLHEKWVKPGVSCRGSPDRILLGSETYTIISKAKMCPDQFRDFTKAAQNKLYVLPQLAHTLCPKIQKKTHIFSFTFGVFFYSLCCFLLACIAFPKKKIEVKHTIYFERPDLIFNNMCTLKKTSHSIK